MIKVILNIVYPKDNWILQKIAQELLKINSKSVELTSGQKRSGDINYYINWAYWKILYPELPKSKLDIILFTHLDSSSKTYLSVLDKADLIICMSSHGKQELIKRGIPKNKLEVCPYFGISITEKKKIIVGTSGTNCDRKNRQEVKQLKKDLDDNIFEFTHSTITDDKFFADIDYYLQASKQEGGSMDILNAIYSRTPIVSRNIGFIYNNYTPSDFIYENYGELLFYFKGIEQDIKNKDEIIKNCTWDNFRNWHIELFRQI